MTALSTQEISKILKKKKIEVINEFGKVTDKIYTKKINFISMDFLGSPTDNAGNTGLVLGPRRFHMLQGS